MFIRKIKPLGRLIKWFLGSLYDFSRFIKYGGWRTDLSNKEERNYYSAKVYHSLEKSLSFSKNNPDSGWSNADILASILEAALHYKNIGYHDQLGLDVLNKFVLSNSGITKTKLAENVRVRLNHLNLNWQKVDISGASGVIELSDNQIYSGRLINPKSFFGTRYSIREFSRDRVEHATLLEAIELALKTPSACNRQPWHVYHLSDKSKIDLALSHQSGNRGFTDEIEDLLIICSDIKAFNPGSERYQHWIDGGMFSMSLVYTLHSKGIASCCLNWSQQGIPDKKFRDVFPQIDNSHTIIMMLAIGKPKENNFLCVSPRRPLNEIYSEI
ncbi:nitroreductase family protein [Vibrio vulnificus]